MSKHQIRGVYNAVVVEHEIYIWKLVEPFYIAIPLDNVYYTFIVPDGFETDFASVPRIFWTLLPPTTGYHAIAAILHDWLYYANITTRKEADRLFYKAMLELGVPKCKAYVIYKAVDLFGFKGWNRYRRQGYNLQYWIEQNLDKSYTTRFLFEHGLGYIFAHINGKPIIANDDIVMTLDDLVNLVRKQRANK